MVIAIGVTTKKNIIPITIGEIIFPSTIPNLNQTLFKGVKTTELNIPKTRNIKDIIIDQILISPPDIKGYKAISKNTAKKTIPKLRFELTLISSI